MKNYFKFIILALGFTLFSCGRTLVEYLVTTHYIYKNSTTSTVNILEYDINDNLIATTVLNPQESKTIISQRDGEEFGIAIPFGRETTPTAKVKIRFVEDNKCVTYTNNQGMLNYENYDNYNPSMLNNRINELHWDIGSEEKSIAVNCN